MTWRTLVTFTLNYVGLTHHHPLVMDAAVISGSDGLQHPERVRKSCQP
jgi:hypothetical protein